MHTKIRLKIFLVVETERSDSLDVLEYHTQLYDFILWKNEGEYAIINKGQIKEARRVHEELERAPEDQMSTAKPPVIHWDDCVPVGLMRAEVMLGKEHQLYRETEKPEDGSHS